VRPTLHLTAAVTPHAGQFLARCLEVEDLSACGSSVQAAVRALAELAAHKLADLQPPYPPHAFIVSLDIQLATDQPGR
jgi:hypothetical protein